MVKAYSRIVWVNYPETDTPLNDTNLNRMDNALDVIDDRVVAMDTTKANQSDLLSALSNVTYNDQTGVFVFTWKNGNTLTVDLNIEKIPVSFSMSPQGVITMTTSDGTTYTADVSELIKTYSFNDSSDIDFTVTTDASGNKTVTATIVDGSITASKLQPNYLADVTAQAQAASTSAGASEGFSEDSEAWAIGQRDGQDVPSTDPTYHNNAYYWALQARSIVGDKVDSFNGRTGVVTPQSGDYAIEQITPTSGSTVGQIPVVRNVGGQNVFNMENPPSSAHKIMNENGTQLTQRDYLQFTGDVSVTDDSNTGRTVVNVTGGSSGGHTIVDATGTDMAQESKLQFTGDVTVTDDSTNGKTVVNISGGGHTIKNSAGTNLTQRDTMQFKGFLKATDDGTNLRTVIDDSAEEITWSDWNAMTDAEKETYSAGKRINITNVPGADGTISADMLTKLWENPNPTQAFAGQNIALSSSDYDLLLFISRFDTGGDTAVSTTIVQKGQNALISYCFNTSIWNRTIAYNSNTLYVAADGYAGGVVSNTSCIPVVIYGIKKSFTFKVSAIASDVSTSADKCMLSDNVTSVEDLLEKKTYTVTSASGCTVGGTITKRAGVVVISIYVQVTTSTTIAGWGSKTVGTISNWDNGSKSWQSLNTPLTEVMAGGFSGMLQIGSDGKIDVVAISQAVTLASGTYHAANCSFIP